MTVIDQDKTRIMEAIMRDQERRFVMNNIAKPATGETSDGKPRICEVLGGKDNPLEVGEVFTIRGYPNREYRYAVVHTDGKLHNYLEEPCRTTGTRVGNKIGVNSLYWLLAHPESIIRKPRFSEEEVAAAKMLLSAGAVSVYKDEHGTLRWTSGEYVNSLRNMLPHKLFPSLRPGQSVALADIVGA